MWLLNITEGVRSRSTQDGRAADVGERPSIRKSTDDGIEATEGANANGNIDSSKMSWREMMILRLDMTRKSRDDGIVCRRCRGQWKHGLIKDEVVRNDDSAARHI